MLYRPRNTERLTGVRRTGAKCVLLDHGDVGPSLVAALEGSSVHAVAGIGGTPEGIAIACALRGLGGEIQGRLAPQFPDEAHAVLDFFDDPEALLTSEDLVASGPAWFVATGLTGGGPFSRVEPDGEGWKTRTLVVSHAESSGSKWLDIFVDAAGIPTVV
jgi:fructose-1,6-bisphosphatase II